MGKSRSQRSIHDKLMDDWEIANADELGDDADFNAEDDSNDYPDGFED